MGRYRRPDPDHPLHRSAHGYLPPEQFIAALEEWTEPESVTFEALEAGARRFEAEAERRREAQAKRNAVRIRGSIWRRIVGR
jgi:hypothetical protein